MLRFLISNREVVDFHDNSTNATERISENSESGKNLSRWEFYGARRKKKNRSISGTVLSCCFSYASTIDQEDKFGPVFLSQLVRLRVSQSHARPCSPFGEDASYSRAESSWRIDLAYLNQRLIPCNESAARCTGRLRDRSYLEISTVRLYVRRINRSAR